MLHFSQLFIYILGRRISERTCSEVKFWLVTWNWYFTPEFEASNHLMIYWSANAVTKMAIWIVDTGMDMIH